MRVHLTNDRMNAQLKLFETHDRLNCDAVVYVSSDWAAGPSAIFVTDRAMADMRVYVTTDAFAADGDDYERAGRAYRPPTYASTTPQSAYGSYGPGSAPSLREIARGFFVGLATWVFGFLMVCGVFGIVGFPFAGYIFFIWWPMIVFAGSCWVLYKLHGEWWRN